MDGLGRKTLDPTTAPRIVLMAAIFLSPSFFDLGSVKPFDVSKVTILWFFGWLAFGLSAVEMIRGHVRPLRFRLAIPTAVFVVGAGLSTVFSKTRGVYAFGWYGRFNGFVELALYVVLFWLVVQLYWRRPERAKEIVYA